MKGVRIGAGGIGKVCAVVLLAGLGLTVFGLMTHTGGRLLPWPIREAAYFLLFVGVAGFAFGRTSRYGKASALLLTFVGFAMLAGQLWPLAVSVAFALASHSLGGYVLSKLRGEHFHDQHVNRMLVGAGTYGLVVGAMAHWPVNYPALYAVMVAMPLWLGRREWMERHRASVAWLRAADVHSRRPDAVRGLLCALALVHFVYALMPELGYDALALHLLVPSQLLHRHQWGFDPSLYAMALIPMLGDWIFSVGYLLAGETASRLINLSFSYLLAHQSYRLAIWLLAEERWARFAPALLLSTPLMFTETNSLHVEAVWSCFVVGGALTLLRMVGDRDVHANSIALAALLLALAANAKAITFLFLPPLAVLCLFKWRQAIAPAGGVRLILALMGFLVIAVIPYATAYAISGNPVFPFYNGYFKSIYFTAQSFNNSLYNSGLGWATPYTALFDAGKYIEGTTGAAGFQWLILFPAAVLAAVWSRSLRLCAVLLVVVISTFLVFRSQSYLRYILPVYALGVALVVAAFSVLEDGSRGKALLKALCAVVIGLNLVFFCSATWTYRSVPWGLLVNLENRDDYLLRKSPVRLAVEVVNQINIHDRPVAFFTREIYGAGLRADALYANWYNQRFADRVRTIRSPADLANVMASYGGEYFVVAQDFGGEFLQQAIEAGSDEIVRFAKISVRRLKNETRFGTELLRNPELRDGKDWVLSPGATLLAQGIKANVTAPILQGIRIEPGRLYRNEVTARCAGPRTQGRVQVNWEDATGKMVGSDIKLFECDDEDRPHRQEVVAPRDASVAIVYGGSNTSDAVVLTRISFR
jgi:hypothetical protein